MNTVKLSKIPESFAPEKALEQFIVELNPAIQNLKGLIGMANESYESSNKVFEDLEETADTIQKYILFEVKKYLETQWRKTEEVEREVHIHIPYQLDYIANTDYIMDMDTAESILFVFAHMTRASLGKVSGIVGFIISREYDSSRKHREKLMAELFDQIREIEEAHINVRDNWKTWVK